MGANRVVGGESPLLPSLLSGVALLCLLTQAALSAYLLTLSNTSGASPIGAATLSLSIIVALMVGYDALNAKHEHSDWQPRAALWAVPMVFPGLNLGFGLAYIGRRLQFQRGADASKWVWVAVGAGMASGLGLTALVVRGTPTQPLPLSTAATQIYSLALFGLTTPAAYFDSRYVNRQFDEAGSRWLLSGYHWVALLTVPFPIRVLIALAYAIRRKMMLDKLAAKIGGTEAAGVETEGEESLSSLADVDPGDAPPEDDASTETDSEEAVSPDTDLKEAVSSETESGETVPPDTDETVPPDTDSEDAVDRAESTDDKA